MKEQSAKRLVEEESALDFMMDDPGGERAQLSAFLKEREFGPGEPDMHEDSMQWLKRLTKEAREWIFIVRWHSAYPQRFTLDVSVDDLGKSLFAVASTLLRPLEELPTALEKLEEISRDQFSAPMEAIVKAGNAAGIYTRLMRK